MSRSKHTTPESIRAAARVRAPYARRSAGDRSAWRSEARVLKELGLTTGPFPPTGEPASPVSLPRITIQQPRGGTIQPLSERDVEAALCFFGPRCWYGIRTIELVGRPDTRRGTLCMASFLTPGRILIYHQPTSPWIWNGDLPQVVGIKLQRTGAIIDSDTAAGQTIIHWPADTLRRFMLFEGLLHEVGHHILQHYAGKRRARIARTRDHEAFADRFVDRCRAAYESASGPFALCANIPQAGTPAPLSGGHPAPLDGGAGVPARRPMFASMDPGLSLPQESGLVS